MKKWIELYIAAPKDARLFFGVWGAIAIFWLGAFATAMIQVFFG